MRVFNTLMAVLFLADLGVFSATRLHAQAASRYSTACPATNGNPDRDFMVMMIPHHQTAIGMAKAEIRYGKNARLRAMARNIITSQKAEIDQMRAMLR